MTDLPDIYGTPLADEMVNYLRPITDMFGGEEHLQIYCNGLCLMLQPIDDICADGPNGEPGWSQIFDLARMKTSWLPWAGQLNGYQVPAKPDSQTLAEYDALQRDRIVTRRADTKGTTDRMVLDVKDHLHDPKRVIVRERFDDDHAQIRVWVYEADIETSDAEITKAALGAKLAGLLMEFVILPATATYDELLAASDSYDDVLSTFVDYIEVLTDPDHDGTPG